MTLKKPSVLFMWMNMGGRLASESHMSNRIMMDGKEV